MHLHARSTCNAFVRQTVSCTLERCAPGRKYDCLFTFVPSFRSSFCPVQARVMSSGGNRKSNYRADGVRITHDPYAPGVAEKYGLPGRTDPEGFDPYADTVGPGIYGGSVKRDSNTGEVRADARGYERK